MNQKISGKQKLAEPFDISNFVEGADPTDDVKSPAAAPTKNPSRAGGVVKKVAIPKPTKPIPKAEPLSERLQIKLTVAEMVKMKKAAGLAPLSVYARKFLKDKGLI